MCVKLSQGSSNLFDMYQGCTLKLGVKLPR